jgi:hypothetical protein
MSVSGNAGGAQERVVVGYFVDGGDAYRAINELMDEGFRASEVGAAFRTPRAGAGDAMVEGAAAGEGEMKSVRELTETNPAVSGSVGGVASHDEAVTPAGLAPGSGNAFPAPPSKPGPIPGGEIPSTLRHELRHDLPATPEEAREAGIREPWLGRLDERYARSSERKAPERRSWEESERKSSQKFGTGEGRLGLDVVPAHGYSAPVFEGSFQGMGIGADEARRLSGELGGGGAVVAVRAGARSSLAQGILERNHGRVRMESVGAGVREADRESSVEVYGAMCAWYPGEEERRKAS